MIQPLRHEQNAPQKARVAIIEDDRSIQNLIIGSLLLEIESIDAIKFSNARDAIHELWEKNMIGPPNIDALFIDIFLEDQTSGIDVLEYCQFIPKDIPIVLMSSQFTDEQLSVIAQFSTTPVLLRKPFGPEEIIQLTKWIFDLNARRYQ